MTIHTVEKKFRTSGENDIQDITNIVNEAVKESGARAGVVSVFVPGSTAAVTTMEYEPGLKQDLPSSLERLAPKKAEYKHHLTWGDDNGHSHVRASLIGPSLVVPFKAGRILNGTWQQVVLVELDTGPRDRNLILTVIGD